MKVEKWGRLFYQTIQVSKWNVFAWLHTKSTVMWRCVCCVLCYCFKSGILIIEYLEEEDFENSFVVDVLFLAQLLVYSSEVERKCSTLLLNKFTISLNEKFVNKRVLKSLLLFSYACVCVCICTVWVFEISLELKWTLLRLKNLCLYWFVVDA